MDGFGQDARGAARRPVLAALGLATAALGCGPLPPVAGLPEYQEIAAIALPGPVLVNVAGGNLIVRRVDLELDTQLGPLAVAATWNGATRRWSWSLDDVRLVAEVFEDATGARHDLRSLANGRAIPGTVWVKAGPTAVKTKGGLRYEFSKSGALARIRWTSRADPHLRFQTDVLGDGREHLVRIEQCFAGGGGCRAVCEFLYDSAGRPVAVGDRAGRRAEFAYDAQGRLAFARDGLDVDRSWPGFRYEYGAAGDLVAITRSEGERVELGYDAEGRVTSVRQVGDAATGSPLQELFYEGGSAGLWATRYRDALGHETRFRYDMQRRVHEVESLATGERARRTWADLRVASLVLPSGATTRWGWVDDDVAKRTEPSGNVITWRYAPGGESRAAPLARPIREVRDDLDLIERRAYDAAGRLVSITNAAGETATYRYGPDGMIDRMTSPAGVVTTFAGYGEHGLPTLLVVGQRVEQRRYDAVGNQIAGDQVEGRPELGGVVAREYDADRNLKRLRVADVSGTAGPQLSEPQAIELEHRSDGRWTAIRRPGDGDHEFDYDALGRLAAVRERVSNTWQTSATEFDAAGRPVVTELANGMRRETAFDALGRIVRHAVLRDGAVEARAEFRYEGGLLRAVDDSTHAGPERYEYDSAGRLAAIDFADGERLELAHDLRSRPTRERYRLRGGFPLREIHYAYDPAGRQIEIRDGSIALLTRIFAQGRLLETGYGNGLRRRYDYDPTSGSLAGSTTTDANGAPVESTSLGEVVSPWAMTITADTTTWGLAAATSRETYSLGPVPAESTPEVFSQGKRVIASEATGKLYAYDALGNQQSASDSFAYNAESNRLLSATVGGRSLSYDYDAAGFVTSRGGVPLAWTASGRLAAYGSRVALEWDLLDRLIRSRVDGVETRWRFGGRVAGDPDGNPVAIDLGEVRIDLGGRHLYRHLDFRGNAKFATDDRGQVIAHYEYGPYGVERGFGVDADPVRFVGRMEIGEDLMILGARIYDPLVGRFLSPDPILQILNQYAYAFGNPVWFHDRDGTTVWTRAGQIAVGLLVGVLVTIGTGLVVGGVLAGNLLAVQLGFVTLATALTVATATAILSTSPSGGGGSSGSCAPTELTSLPDAAWLLWLLIPLQIALAARALGASPREGAPC